MTNSDGRPIGFLIYATSVLQAIVTLVISWITLSGPSGPALKKFSLLTITPSTPTTRGPSVWLGLFSSCVQGNVDQNIECIPFSFDFNTKHNFSVLPPNAPSFVLESPPAILKGLVCFTLVLSHIFLVLVAWMAFRLAYKSLRTEGLEKGILKFPMLSLVGMFLIAVGLMNFGILQLYFDKTCEHFNEFVRLQGGKGPKLIATRGKAFTWAYWGYGLAGIPFLVAAVDAHHSQAGNIEGTPPPPPPPPPPTTTTTATKTKIIFMRGSEATKGTPPPYDSNKPPVYLQDKKTLSPTESLFSNSSLYTNTPYHGKLNTASGYNPNS